MNSNPSFPREGGQTTRHMDFTETTKRKTSVRKLRGHDSYFSERTFLQGLLLQRKRSGSPLEGGTPAHAPGVMMGHTRWAAHGPQVSPAYSCPVSFVISGANSSFHITATYFTDIHL